MKEIYREASDRIVAVVRDYECQINLLSYVLSLLVKERTGQTLLAHEEQALVISVSIQSWVGATHANAVTLSEANDDDYTSDEKWPAVPNGALEFMANF